MSQTINGSPNYAGLSIQAFIPSHQELDTSYMTKC